MIYCAPISLHRAGPLTGDPVAISRPQLCDGGCLSFFLSSWLLHILDLKADKVRVTTLSHGDLNLFSLHSASRLHIGVRSATSEEFSAVKVLRTPKSIESVYGKAGEAWDNFFAGILENERGSMFAGWLAKVRGVEYNAVSYIHTLFLLVKNPTGRLTGLDLM